MYTQGYKLCQIEKVCQTFSIFCCIVTRKLQKIFFKRQTISHLDVLGLKELIKSTYSQYFSIVLIKNTKKCFESNSF